MFFVLNDPLNREKQQKSESKWINFLIDLQFLHQFHKRVVGGQFVDDRDGSVIVVGVDFV